MAQWQQQPAPTRFVRTTSRPVVTMPAIAIPPAAARPALVPNVSTPLLFARNEYDRMPQHPIHWFHTYKRTLGVKDVPKSQRHPSYIGHALLCYLLTKEFGMILKDHEPHRRIGKRVYNPDLVFEWGNCIVYCEVKCVDSYSQQQNYAAVKRQCRVGLARNRRRNNMLFVGFVVKERALGFSISLGYYAEEFKQYIQGKCKTAEQLQDE